jgi:hypothetical protein
MNFTEIDYNLCNIEWTNEEIFAIGGLCEREGLSVAQVMRKALRTYQSIVLGKNRLVEVNPLPKKIKLT